MQQQQCLVLQEYPIAVIHTDLQNRNYAYQGGNQCHLFRTACKSSSNGRRGKSMEVISKTPLTQVIKLNATMPTARAEWASRPSNASAERVIWRCKSTSASETKTDTEKTHNVMLT